jgi:hypothetical protein
MKIYHSNNKNTFIYTEKVYILILIFTISYNLLTITAYGQSQTARPVFPSYISNKTNNNIIEKNTSLNKKTLLNNSTEEKVFSAPGPGGREKGFPINIPLDAPKLKSTQKSDVSVLKSRDSQMPSLKINKNEISQLTLSGAQAVKKGHSPEFPIGTVLTRKEELLRLREISFKISGRPEIPFFPIFTGTFKNKNHAEKEEINQNPFVKFKPEYQSRKFAQRPSLSTASRPDRPSGNSGSYVSGTGPGTTFPKYPKIP